MEYNDCGTGCPSNCKYPQGVENCSLSCIKTCECPEGQVLDGETCTFLYNCGCTLDNGVYIAVRWSTFFNYGNFLEIVFNMFYKLSNLD